jgi:uncharacterized protein YndB with AHSA1/START domain
MHHLTLCLAAALFLPLVPAHADAQAAGKWEQIDVDDGIRVWKHEIPGQELPGFRGEVTMDASMEDVYKAITDWKQHTKWMHRCVESLELKHIDDSHSLMYNRTDAPWPVWDRDVILDTRIERAADGKSILLKFQNTESSLKPTPEKVVRMPHLVGFYKLVALGEKKTKVTYQVEANPGGSLPTWMAKRVTKELPYTTLDMLRERVTGED